jgi:deoxyadenosine/deoxycytidine kinase
MNTKTGDNMWPGFIVVEGPIGVGKTSLARRLSQHFGSDVLLEQPDDNPFLERFYQSRRQYALPTQLFFLFQRARQLQQWRQGDMFRPVRVADFLLEKDAIFARLNLDSDELRLYDQVYGQLRIEIPAPDLVVVLQAPVEVLHERVRRRGIGYERGISRDYLAAISDAYTQFFYHYDAAPLLIVNAAQANFVDSEADFAMFVEHLKRVRSGRHYFNPLPSDKA